MRDTAEQRNEVISVLKENMCNTAEQCYEVDVESCPDFSYRAR